MSLKYRALVLFLLTAVIVALSVWFYNGYKSGVQTVNRELREGYTLVDTWELPDILEEISAIAWLDEGRLACVQDENGILFTYNLKSRAIENQLVFAADGDYEGLTVHDNRAYIIRSDGELFIVENFRSENATTSQYNLPISSRNNVEGLAVDAKNDRLLIALKDEDLFNNSYKGVYAFNLTRKTLLKEAVYKIDFASEAFKNLKQHKIKKEFRPSEIAIHPITGHVYLLEAKSPKLLILDAQGKALDLHFFDRETFYQPEGITFSDNGTIYISNEGSSGPPTILEIILE
jgi:uncharacterized protein YjiK